MPRKVKNILYFAMVFIAALAVLTSIHFILRYRESSSSNTKALEIVVPQEAPPSRAIAEHVIPETKLILDLHFHRETWVQIYADNELVIDGTKRSGERVQIKADKELLLHIGNAGGISYLLNGKTGKTLGDSGTVRRNIRITNDNISDFISSENNSDNR